MSTAEPTPPDTGLLDWIVRLGTDQALTATSRHGDHVLLDGVALASIAPPDPCVDRAAIVIRPAGEPLQARNDLIELRCTPRTLPPLGLAPPTRGTDHVVHVLCSRFDDPEAIERFLARTTGIIEHHWSGREAWLEVTGQLDEVDATETDMTLVDDVFVARYPTIDHWRRLNADPRWSDANDALFAEAAVLFDLLLAPNINRMADHR